MRGYSFTVYLLMCCGEVVYVGITCDIKRRLKQHQDKVYTSVIEFKVYNKMKGLYWERKWLLFFAPKYNWMPSWCELEELHDRIGKIGRGQKLMK